MPSSGSFSGWSAAFSAGLATFGDLKASVTGTGFMLKAQSTDFVSSGNSGPFNISLAGSTCTGSSCSIPTTGLGGNSKVGVSATGTFTFLALDQFSLPSPLPAGCLNYRSLGNAGFVLTQGTTPSTGSTAFTFTYALSESLLPPGDNDNDWDDFVPLCAGGQRLNSDGSPVSCMTDKANGLPGWKGRALSSQGRFIFNIFFPSTMFRTAVCEETTGLWWGILSIPGDSYWVSSANPRVTRETTDGTYRSFTIAVPTPWDWKMG
jgi:hypothetical protein